jgi:hypothetical protein
MPVFAFNRHWPSHDRSRKRAGGCCQFLPRPLVSAGAAGEKSVSFAEVASRALASATALFDLIGDFLAAREVGEARASMG